jgi:sterol desaturase/sphingolipid hydroxylase (fatty acid hydroxylase superfamily)
MSTQRKRINAFIIVMNILTWSAVFGAFIFFDLARPEPQSYLDIHYEKLVRKTWDTSLATVSLWFFIMSAAVSMLGLLFNIAYIKKHRISLGLVAGLFLSLGFAGFYIFSIL